MAGIAYVKIRLWNPDAVVGDDSNVLPNKLRKHTHEDSGGYKQLRSGSVGKDQIQNRLHL